MNNDFYSNPNIYERQIFQLTTFAHRPCQVAKNTHLWTREAEISFVEVKVRTTNMRKQKFDVFS